MNRKLGLTARDEIRHAMNGLVGKAAKAEAERLAAIHGAHASHIYRMTTDVRKRTRKTRTDAGRRQFDINDRTSDLWQAVQLVIVDKLDPDQALLTAKVRGLVNLPTLETFRRILCENGLGRQQRRTSRRAYRRWEAESPGQIFQIDCTGLKVRWLDEKTRRILQIEGIDKNHPMQDETKLRLFQIMMVDDHSRRRFMRYVACRAITSFDMVRFECEAFTKFGVPHVLYTDNGSEFKGQHVVAERILNSLLTAEGGYRHERHLPNNPQATGKVEVAHQWAEKMDRYVGLARTEGQHITVDDLNVFADRLCDHYDNRVHRATGQKPIVRWSGTRVVVRKVAPEVVESALLSTQFPAVINDDLTVKYRKEAYQLPRAVPFIDYIGHEVQIVVPPQINLILLTLANGEQYEIEKRLAGVDAAGEYKTVIESKAARITREAKEDRKAAVAAIKEQKQITGQIAPVPHLNVAIDIDKTGVLTFPHQERIITVDEVNTIIPVPSAPVPVSEPGAVATGFNASSTGVAAPTSVGYIGKPITYWQAVSEFKDRFNTPDDCKRFLTNLYSTDTELPITQIEAAIDGRNQERRLKVAS